MSKSLGSGVSKQKRTTRLHWRAFSGPLSNGDSLTIWGKMKPIEIDATKIESLFENKPHDLKKVNYFSEPILLCTILLNNQLKYFNNFNNAEI